MLENKNKVEDVVNDVEEEVVEIEDLDAGIRKEDVEAVKNLNEKKVVEQHVLNKEQQELFKQILEEAKAPVQMTNEKFALGENELDIRGLSKKNLDQLTFRELALLAVYGKQCLTSLVDVTRLLMVIADKLGVEDIVKATDDVIEKVEKQNHIKEKLKTNA